MRPQLHGKPNETEAARSSEGVGSETGARRGEVIRVGRADRLEETV